MAKVALATPCNRQIQVDTYLSLMNMALANKEDLLPMVATNGFTIAENRHYLVARAIREGCTHILFIDDDMVFPADTLERLLKHDKKIVGINCNSRGLPLKSTVEPLEEYLGAGLVEVKAVGSGVLLIDLDVFKTIERPWFGVKTHESGFTLMGEDSWFCERAREKGFKIWCDTTIKIGHIGLYTY
jgi:hypothetical protein